MLDARKSTLTNGVTSTIYGTNINVSFDPVSATFTAVFLSKSFLTIGTQTIASYATIPYGLAKLSISPPLETCYAQAGEVDPITGADLSKISVAGIMQLFEDGFDSGFNQAYYSAQLMAFTNLADGAIPSPSSKGTTSSFTYSISGNTVTFTDSSVAGSNGSIVSYAWIFGDGIGTASQANTSYTYAVAKIYTVQLIVTDSFGENVVSSQQITLVNE